MFKPGIVIHHSATEDSEVLVNYNAVLRFHTRTKGWSDIGYHAVVEAAERGPLAILGRAMHLDGAHARGYNDKLGLCIVGNYDEEHPNNELIRLAIKRVVIPWCKTFHVSAHRVIGHRELDGVSKSCPGRRFDMDRFRSLIQEAL